MLRSLASGALVATALLASTSARAQGPARDHGGADVEAALPPREAASLPPREGDAPTPGHRREVAWDPAWTRFRTGNYVATGLFTMSAFASLAIPPSAGRWSAVSGFDSAARSTLRIGSPRYRAFARDASDLLLTLTLNHVAADALLVTWWWHGRGSVAWELAMIDAEALALNASLNGLVSALTSRERPYRAECAGPEEQWHRDCRSSKRYRSFFSGHSSTAFTAAGLVCSHHAHLPLYGGGAADTLACGASLVAAAAVATLRVSSDQHFATDVLTGAAVGTLTGLGVPWLLHYRRGAASTAGGRRADGVSIRFAPAPLGGYVLGSF